MARRLNPRNAQSVRDRIRAEQLVKRLQDHALGVAEMTSTQIDAAKFLVNKITPNAPERRELTGPDGGDIVTRMIVEFVDAPRRDD